MLPLGIADFNINIITTIHPPPPPSTVLLTPSPLYYLHVLFLSVWHCPADAVSGQHQHGLSGESNPATGHGQLPLVQLGCTVRRESHAHGFGNHAHAAECCGLVPWQAGPKTLGGHLQGFKYPQRPLPSRLATLPSEGEVSRACLHLASHVQNGKLNALGAT
jgi:hypothetical protein